MAARVHCSSTCFTCRIRIFKRTQTSRAKTQIDFLLKQPEVLETIERFSDLLLYLLPKYQREGKSYLTIGIGCTGGRHRSVMVANSLKKILKEHDFDASVSHRDMQK